VGRVCGTAAINIPKYVVGNFTLRKHLPSCKSRNSRVRAGYWQYFAM